MRSLDDLLRLNKSIRVIGFDDAPFARERGSLVNISGIICSNAQFEGMLWGETTKDGVDATETLAVMLLNSKFYAQVHVVLTDGIAVGGFNMIDLPKLAELLQRPCIAVMRKMPDLVAIDHALQNFDDYAERKACMERAGEIYQASPFVYQTAGCSPETAASLLSQLTINGNVPEALRIAHLIGSAIKTGQSSQRA